MADTTDQLYEQTLVLRCQTGDEAAFVELVERYQPRMRYYLRKMLRDANAADDVLQEVWLDVFRGVNRLTEVGAFRAWLYQIARNRAYRQLRKRRLNYEPFEEVELLDSSAEDAKFEADDAACVHAGLDELAPLHREVLVLRYIEAMTYEEIARVVDCKVGTVRSRLHYGTGALRAILERKKLND
jgi:RNA polymerase sigma-70 factor (ECF subfamily)